MSKWKKSLAMVLTAAMLLSVLPVSTWAAESEPEPDDEVVFNLGTMDVTVGTDQARAEEGQEPYDLFQPDGSYTLELEPDAFFPYEVQFTHDGQTQQVWFMDPEDTVDVGGHTFGVFSESTDPNKLTQIGIWVGEDYIPAYPEEKTFTNDGPEAMPISGGLPLAKEVQNVNLDLSKKYLPSQLTDVRVSAVLSGVGHNGTESDRVAWVRSESEYDRNDDFQILDQSGTMDLSYRYGSFHIDLLVGSALQLDKGNNTLYQVNVTVPKAEMFQWDVLAGTASVKSGCYYYEDSYGDIKTDGFYEVELLSEVRNAENLKLKVNFSDEYDANGKNASVYLGLYETEEALSYAQEITDQIWGPDAAGIDVKNEDQIELTIVLKNSDGTVAGVLPQTVVLVTNSITVWPDSLYTAEDPYTSVLPEKSDGAEGYEKDGIKVFNFMLARGYANDDTYALMLSYDKDNNNYLGTCDEIQKAVEGLYQTLDQAADQPDLKEKLFVGTSEYGKFTADFSKGVNFTVFDIYGGVHQFCVRTTETSTKPTVHNLEENSPLSADTYFRANGIAESENYYVMDYGNDSYYSNGYQTVFTTDDVDLSHVRLNFFVPEDGWTFGPAAKIYAGHIGNTGSPQESGVTVNDFSKGPVQYAATAQNGKDLKNYWVTVVKTDSSATSGKLFVNGINGSQGAKRTVFLTQAYGYHHDIFLANVGGGNLTNLKVKLTDAKNVQLDEFWTIGGDGNNTLAPLNIENPDSASDGIAKIRLVPERNADGTIKAGAVSGKLTITAEGQKSVVIELTGVAFQPEITSGDLPDGVKYVPYGQLIMTNNEYDWLNVAIKQTRGELPDGMTFRENGELYGVPQTTGEYEVDIKAEYTVNEKYTEDYNYTGDLVGDSYNRAYLYLTILDNTAENVEAQTDVQDGYGLLDGGVKDMTDYHSQEFHSNGEYGNFVDFWLDGVKLVEGQDYDSEEGSTKITIRSQTFQKAGSGSHTIAAEFRHGGKNDLNSPLKKTAQVYKANTSGGGSSGGGGGGSSSGTSKGFDAGVSQAPNGTITVTPKTAAKGKLVTVTVTPDAGYRLDKLTATGKNGDDLTLTDIGGGKYTFVMPTGGARVSGSFVKIIQAAEGQPFEDVPQGAWFVDAVKYVYQNGLMAGTSATTFSPYANTSRGMIVTVLHGMCGKPVFEGCVFSDVEEGAYYAKATCWASQNQIISGFGQGKFGPDEDVQRDQLAVIMMRYAQYLGLETPERADLSGFADADQISAYAQEAMSWANAVGLLSGKGDGIMDPQGVATRAEVAAMMARLDQMVKQTEG